MKVIADNCSLLTFLDVSLTEGEISDDSIERVANNCRQLRLLDVSDTAGKVTKKSLSLVVATCRIVVARGRSTATS